MANLFHAVHAWWTVHPGWVNLIYFLLAVMVSLFADRVRRLLSLPVLYSAKSMRSLMERDTKRNLEVMHAVGDSTFKLVLYIACYSLDSFVWIFWQSMTIWIVLNFLIFRHDPHRAPLSPLVFGLTLAQALKLKYLLEGLFNPEQTIQRLEESLSKKAAK
jgi:hypothetical protein